MAFRSRLFRPLISASADLFVCESYVFEKEVALYNSYRAIMDNLPRLDCKKIILTHMSDDMLSRAHEIELPMAEDGLWLHL